MGYWTKKIDQIHITNKEGNTFCGKPMLGNNYYRDEQYKELDKIMGKERGICPKCQKEAKRIVSWTINVEYADGTTENFSDMPNQLSQEIDAWLTEIEHE